MRIEQEFAYVLHRRAFGETSAVVEFLTQNHGRVAAMAKGAKALPKRGKDLLQPAVLFSISLTGSGELAQLRQAEAQSTAPLLQGERLLSLLYVNELLINLLPKNDAHASLFDAYQFFLQQLGATPLAQLLRAFELTVLRELGYAPEFDMDAEGADIEPDSHYRFQEEVGLVKVEAAGRNSTYSGQSLISIASGQFDGEATRAARRLFRELISHHLHGKELKSWGMLAELEALRELARES